MEAVVGQVNSFKILWDESLHGGNIIPKKAWRNVLRQCQKYSGTTFRKNRKKCPRDKMSAKIEKMPSGQKCPKNDAIVKRGLNLNLKLKINFCLDFRSCEKVSSRVLDHFLFQHIEFNNL